MKEYILFFNGSSDLPKEQKWLDSLTNELNNLYKDTDVRFSANCNNPSYNQDEVNDYIKRADVAIFLLSGDHKFIEEALSKTIESYGKSRKPRIILFRNDEQAIPESIIIQNYIKENPPTQYSNYEDFKKEIMDIVVPEINAPLRSSLEEKATKVENKAKKNILIALMGWLAIIAISFFALKHYNKDNKVLLFVGGGSVSEFLKHDRDIDLDSWHNSIHINLPSGLAYAILGEEGNRKDHTFVPIVLSAGRVPKDKDSVFTDVSRKLSNKLVIIEYWLGQDPLTIYAETSFLNKNLKLEDSIVSCDSFTTLLQKGLEPGTGYVYATNPHSGTREAYKRLLSSEKKSMIDTPEIRIFHPYDEDSGVREDYSLILCSKFFHPYSGLGEYKELRVADSSGIVYKDLFLYFPAYKINADKGGYTRRAIIPHQVMAFLKSISREDTPFWSGISPHGEVSIDDQTLVLIREDPVFVERSKNR